MREPWVTSCKIVLKTVRALLCGVLRVFEKNRSKSITYEGVRITPIKNANGIDLKFSYGGHTVVVKNYTKSEFDGIFGL